MKPRGVLIEREPTDEAAVAPSKLVGSVMSCVREVITYEYGLHRDDWRDTPEYKNLLRSARLLSRKITRDFASNA